MPYLLLGLAGFTVYKASDVGNAVLKVGLVAGAGYLIAKNAGVIK